MRMGRKASMVLVSEGAVEGYGTRNSELLGPSGCYDGPKWFDRSGMVNNEGLCKRDRAGDRLWAFLAASTYKPNHHTVDLTGSQTRRTL